MEEKEAMFRKLMIAGSIILTAVMTSATAEMRPASLAEAFSDDFLIGAALAPVHYEGAQRDLVVKHFNAIVAENVMKMEHLRPTEDTFFWDEADAFVALGEKHGMHITGHALAWYLQHPDWLFVDDEGNDVSREVLLERMKNHITTVMTRYKGRVQSWDVVNEAVDDDGSLRPGKFTEIIGPDWVEHMFRFAAKADPDAKLYYNDYLLTAPAKREGVYRLIKSIQESGVRVDGIGLQQHVSLNHPSTDEIAESIVSFAELGDVLITELDVSVLPYPDDDLSADIQKNFAFDPKLNPYADGLPPEVEKQLNDRFVELFRVYEDHAEHITRVTTWGVTDTHSWRNYWPVPGRTDYPLLFDRDLTAKPAVQRILSSKKTGEPER